MKKTLSLLLLLLTSQCFFAQTYDSLCHHSLGWYLPDLRNMMELRDGSLLGNCQLFNIDESGYYINDYGNRLLKVVTQQDHLMAAVDSAFIADDDMDNFLFCRNPLQNNNVYAHILRNQERQESTLEVSFFDDDLVFTKEFDLTLENHIIAETQQCFLIDPNNDIIINYRSMVDNMRYFVRVGLDGTLKHKHGIRLSDMPINYYYGGMRVFNESPLEYAVWGVREVTGDKTYYHNFDVYILDSLFTLTDHLSLPPDLVSEDEYHYDCGAQDKVLGLNDGTFLTATRYTEWNTLFDGTAVTKFGRNTLGFIKQIRFPTRPESNFGAAFPIGLETTPEGDLYFAYNTQDPTGPIGRVSVVKMDRDFNIIWQRFCLEPFGKRRLGTQMVALEHGGVALGGLYSGQPNTLFFLRFDDLGWGTPESESLVRPYVFYPNPAQDELHLQYSPDVAPKQVELYDLQGRLVRSQTNALQSLNMEGLAAGQYVMKVTLKDGNTFVDKVFVYDF